MDTQQLMADLVADTKAHIARTTKRPHVYLVYLNDAVVCVAASRETARDEAASLRHCYAGPWMETSPDRWQSELVPLVLIEERELV